VIKNKLQLGAAAGANGIAARRVDAQSREDEMADYEIFELGDVVLQSAITLRGAAPGLNPVDVKFIDDALKELLASRWAVIARTPGRPPARAARQGGRWGGRRNPERQGTYSARDCFAALAMTA
jgi:hypothetical protein